MILDLSTLKQTKEFAQSLSTLTLHHNFHNLLLFGDLGAGKTTFSRFFVEKLPGGNLAEIASPSFTICNIYSTSPEVHHYDLYRLEYGIIDESLTESFETPNVLVIVEWAERLSVKDLPEEGIIVKFAFSSNSEQRTAELEALGSEGKIVLEQLSLPSIQRNTSSLQ